MTDATQTLFPLARHEVDCIAVAYDELLSYFETVGYEGSLDDEEMPSEKIPETLATLRSLLDRYAKFEALTSGAARHGGVVEVAPVRFEYHPAERAEAMTLLQASNPMTRTTFLPPAGLLCEGNEPHYFPMPSVHTDGPTGAVECGECGAPMAVVDIITVERRASWASLSYLSRGRRYFGV